MRNALGYAVDVLLIALMIAGVLAVVIGILASP